MAKRPSKNKCRPTNQSPGDREAIFLRKESLRFIIRNAFAEQGTKPCQADADLSTKLSEELFRLIEQTGTNGAGVRRRAQLFATMRLLEIEVRGQPDTETTANFLVEVLGREVAPTLTEDDFKALHRISRETKILLVQPQWSAVHAGHVAMSCMSLLSLYDVSFLNWRMPQGGGVR